MEYILVIVFCFITGLVLQNINKLRDKNKLAGNIAIIIIVLLFILAFRYIIYSFVFM